MGRQRPRRRRRCRRDYPTERRVAPAGGRRHAGRLPWWGAIPEVAPVEALIERRLGGLRVSVRRNLALLTVAMLLVFRAVRGGYGRLSLSALARSLPSAGDLAVKYKRLLRFLANKHFGAETMVPELAPLVVGRVKHRLVPVLVDQTDIAGVPTLMAGVIHRGRVLPIGFTCFAYRQLRRSQNTLETAFFQLLLASLPPGARPVFTADRQYGRGQLLLALNELGQLFILRGKGKVILWQDGRRRMMRHFRCAPGTPVRYGNLVYREDGVTTVDLIVYFEPGFKQVWYLLVPAGSEAALPTRQVVNLYRSRMQIEQGFRDWKTHLGVRGLKLQKDVALRLPRLLLALAIAYICVLLLGASAWAEPYRRRFETLRRRPRHGTRRTLSVLTFAMQLLGAPDLLTTCRRQLRRILRALTRGAPAYQGHPALETAT